MENSRTRTPSWPPSRRLGGLSGLAVPAVFWTGVFLATWGAWDFLHDAGWTLTNHATSEVPWPSGTALAESGWIMNLTFALSGLLLFVFARAFRRELRRPIAGRVAGGLLTIAALALMASVFNTNPGYQPETWHAWVHLIAFFVLMLSSLAGLIATAVAVRGDERWRGLGRAAVAVVFVMIASLVAVPNDAGFYLVVLALFGWFGAAGLRMMSLAEGQTSRVAHGAPRERSAMT